LHDYGIQLGGTAVDRHAGILCDNGIVIELDSRWVPGNSNYIGCASDKDTGYNVYIFTASIENHIKIPITDAYEQWRLVETAMNQMRIWLENMRELKDDTTKDTKLKELVLDAWLLKNTDFIEVS
jgi:hypothetical protein